MMFSKKTKLCAAVSGALMLLAGQAGASGFALIEQGVGLGNAFAGGAAAAEDAGTIFSNPAGMSRLAGTQASAGGSVIIPSAKFSDTGSTGALLQTAGGNGGNAGGAALVPNAFMTMELDAALHFGLGISVPFGLQTDYDPTWIGRFQAIKSKIETINLNPSLAYRVNDRFSIGAGVSYQHISGELSSAVNYSAAIYQATSGGTVMPNLEGVSTINGSDAAWGYNFGALFNVTPDMRLGVAYRSQMKYTLTGTVAFSGVPAALSASPTLANGDVILPITLPDSFSVSAFHQMNSGWDVMADASWTGWSALKELKIDRSSGANVLTVPENWKNTWRVSAGANYHYNEQWLARVGVAFDQSPVPDAYRTARIPDSDRTWLSFGGQYKPSKADRLDFAYAYLAVKAATIADDQAAGGKGDLVGSYSSNVHILNVQYAHQF
jgi:long-chain fatty acid transport protein